MGENEVLVDFYKSVMVVEMDQRRIVVVGGGPSGLMAAGQAARAGAETVLFEKMKRPGRKLCITGKGRCNVTNVAEQDDFISHFGRGGRFLRQAFARFFAPELMDFLNEFGLELVKERGGRVFPASGKAPEVTAVLLKWLDHCGVRIKRSAGVDALIISDGRITGVVCNGEKMSCDAVILATGGASYPATGSTGDGYRLAKSAGHSIVPIRPALVPLKTSGGIAGEMADLNLRNVGVRMLVDGKKRRQAFGELVFTKFGLTGPIILTLSGDVVDALRGGLKVVLAIDLKPALDEKKLDARLVRDFCARGREELESVLRGLLPREMVPVCLRLTEIPADCMACRISAQQRRRLRIWLKDFRLEVTGSRPLAEAIITAGGVDTREVDPRTMESRKTRGLFIVGELLDLQADTGGYNLQAAFSTGWLAGRAAAKADN